MLTAFVNLDAPVQVLTAQHSSVGLPQGRVHTEFVGKSDVLFLDHSLLLALRVLDRRQVHRLLVY